MTRTRTATFTAAIATIATAAGLLAVGAGPAAAATTTTTTTAAATVPQPAVHLTSTGSTGSTGMHSAAANVSSRRTHRAAGSAVIAPSGCAVSVADFTSSTPGDDTPAFSQAIAAAVSSAPACYPSGPSGAPQAVVYVPAGTYRVANLTFPSNLRMEVDAAATLQLPADRASVPAGQNVSMLIFDAAKKNAPPATNITLIGVGSNLSAAKAAIAATGGAPLAPFNLAGDFTLNLDAAATGATNYNTGVEAVNVQHFDIENLLTIQNATNQPNTPTVAWPTSARSVIRLHASQFSPVGGPYLQPMYGTIHNQVNINSPRGYGPNQINGAQYVNISDIYTNGGTALRLETDGSTSDTGTAKLGATVTDLTASDIIGVNCNRAVSLSPHAQHNGTVTITGVWAYSCNQGVVASLDQSMLPNHLGSFDNATITNLNVTAGPTAQLDSTTTLWITGQSMMPICMDPNLSWNPTITLTNATGTFTRYTP